MSQINTFVKKELLESYRNGKIIAVTAVFITILGIMNPLIALVTPYLLKAFIPAEMGIEIADPTAFDSWLQFYSNMTQIGLVVIVVIYSGVLTGEYNRGTLINMLTKGLSRKNVIYSKYISAAFLWTVAYTFAFMATWIVTEIIWDNSILNHVILSGIYFWIFGLFLLAITILGGVIFKNMIGPLLFTGGIAILLMLLNLLPQIKKFNPMTLASSNLNLLSGSVDNGYFIFAFILTVSAIIGILILSVRLFNKKDI